MPETCAVQKNKKLPIATAHIISQELADIVTHSILRFSQRINSISEVNKFAYKVKGNVITIWTFINSPTPTQLKKIHAIEMNMIENCQDINFDFTVIFKAKGKCPSGFIEISL
jgi:hypothetical protein